MRVYSLSKYLTMDVSINIWAVLAATASSVVIGFLWYGPLFGKAWIRWSGFSAQDIEKGKAMNMGPYYGAAAVGAFITAYVLARFLGGFAVVDMAGAFELAFWVWLGFVVTTQLSSVLWEGKSKKVFALNAACSLVTLCVNAFILTRWM